MEVGQFFNERRFSRIEEEFPDKNQFPLYYKANKTEITIGPGDGLFIPSGWFHFVFSEGDGLNRIDHNFCAFSVRFFLIYKFKDGLKKMDL